MSFTILNSGPSYIFPRVTQREFNLCREMPCCGSPSQTSAFKGCVKVDASHCVDVHQVEWQYDAATDEEHQPEYHIFRLTD